MRISLLFVVFLALLGSACESDSRRSAVYAEKCKEAEQKGFLESAEQLCESAWVDVDNDRLAPAIQTERLYALGRIKRQLSKFAEAEPLIREALAVEETVSGRTSPAYGRLLIELSLVLAGQAKWVEGAAVLEPVLQIADSLPERERLAAANAFKHYASQLRDTDQGELASRFELKATELRAIKQGGAGQAD
jgi:tetratricopeptide (TPR) repeat protein